MSIHIIYKNATQLVERSLPIPEVRGSNPVISQKFILNIYCQLYWKDENKEKSARIEGQQVKFLPYHDRDRNCVGDEADDGQNQAAKSVDPQA